MTKKVYKNRPRAAPQETSAAPPDPARAASFPERADGVKENLKETIDFTIELKAIVKIYDRNCVRLYT